MTLHPLPIAGHRVDFSIHPRLFQTQAKCQCGWRSDWFDRADEASAQWRDHVGIDA